MKKLSVFLSVLMIGSVALAVDQAEFDVSRMKASTLIVYGTGTSTIAGNLTIASGKTLTLTGVTITGGTIGSGAFNGTVGATTPAAGLFTTLGASGSVTLRGAVNFDTSATLASTNATVSLFDTTSTKIDFGGVAAVDVSGSGLATTIKGTFNVDEAATFDTTVGHTGNATFTRLITMTPTALNVTNGQVITPSASAYTLTPYGGTNAQVHTVTMAAPTTTGDFVIFTVNIAATNKVIITDSSPVYGTGATLDAGDSDMYLGQGSVWIRVGGSDN
jgi:hypothetical protein